MATHTLDARRTHETIKLDPTGPHRMRRGDRTLWVMAVPSDAPAPFWTRVFQGVLPTDTSMRMLVSFPRRDRGQAVAARGERYAGRVQSALQRDGWLSAGEAAALSTRATISISGVLPDWACWREAPLWAAGWIHACMHHLWRSGLVTDGTYMQLGSLDGYGSWESIQKRVAEAVEAVGGGIDVVLAAEPVASHIRWELERLGWEAADGVS